MKTFKKLSILIVLAMLFVAVVPASAQLGATDISSFTVQNVDVETATVTIHFYAEEESSVSRIHCTIQRDAGIFKLTDNGSSAGTRLNGRAIPANDPVVLADNDEIVLGDLGRRGVKMRFNIVADSGGAKYSGSADDRTRIIDGPPDHFAGNVD